MGEVSDPDDMSVGPDQHGYGSSDRAGGYADDRRRGAIASLDRQRQPAPRAPARCLDSSSVNQLATATPMPATASSPTVASTLTIRGEVNRADQPSVNNEPPNPTAAATATIITVSPTSTRDR